MPSFTDQAKLDAASTMFETRFYDLFPSGAIPGQWEKFTTLAPTTSKKIQVDFLGAMPVLREWVGAKEFQVQRNYQYTATLKKWEKSFSVERMDVEYDQSGQIGRRINTFTGSLQGFFDKIVTDVFVGNPTGYDGVALFSTSHPHGPSSGTQSNLTTSALSFATADTALTTLMGYRDENGEPFDAPGTITLMVGPKLLPTALEIAEADYKPDAVTAANAHLNVGDSGTPVAATQRYNVWRGKFDVVLNTRLNGTYDDYWFMINTGSPGLTPIILYQGRAPTPVRLDRTDDQPRFINDILLYSVEADAVAVAGAWQTTYAGIL